MARIFNGQAQFFWLIDNPHCGQHIFSSDVYFVSNLPSELQGGDVALICSAGFVLSFLATVYPAWRAAKIEPAHALRYS
ncbi:ABC-type lipoprotein release transport system permease subunit [Pseudomonas laurylsulfatiphila]